MVRLLLSFRAIPNIKSPTSSSCSSICEDQIKSLTSKIDKSFAMIPRVCASLIEFQGKGNGDGEEAQQEVLRLKQLENLYDATKQERLKWHQINEMLRKAQLL